MVRLERRRRNSGRRNGARRSRHWPGTPKARCWRLPRKRATPACWSCAADVPGEPPLLIPAVDLADDAAMNECIRTTERASGKDMLARSRCWSRRGLRFPDFRWPTPRATPQMAQATQPLQSSPPRTARAGGIKARRHTSDHAGAEPARPDAEAQKAGATAGAAACARGEDRAADQGKITSLCPGSQRRTLFSRHASRCVFTHAE